MLDTLEDACVLWGEDDSLFGKDGCPAYVSPEVLSVDGSHSGRLADVWSLGVILYTMLVGWDPFYDLEPGSLFSKIRRGHYSLPKSLTPKARCLIRSILRRDPAQRLTSRDILVHPWLSAENLAWDSEGQDTNNKGGQRSGCPRLVSMAEGGGETHVSLLRMANRQNPPLSASKKTCELQCGQSLHASSSLLLTSTNHGLLL